MQYRGLMRFLAGAGASGIALASLVAIDVAQTARGVADSLS
jgi:hypothetical protein